MFFLELLCFLHDPSVMAIWSLVPLWNPACTSGSSQFMYCWSLAWRILSIVFSSVAQSYSTLCDPMNRSTPGLSVHHQLPEFTQTHVHRVSDAIQPSHPLLSPFSSCAQSFPASESFPRSQLFTSSDQSIGASASAAVFPMNIHCWFPLWLTALILQSKEFSRVISSTTIQKHQFFGARFLYGTTLTSLHDYWKNHSFDYRELCFQSNVSAF